MLPVSFALFKKVMVVRGEMGDGMHQCMAPHGLLKDMIIFII